MICRQVAAKFSYAYEVKNCDDNNDIDDDGRLLNFFSKKNFAIYLYRYAYFVLSKLCGKTHFLNHTQHVLFFFIFIHSPFQIEPAAIFKYAISYLDLTKFFYFSELPRLMLMLFQLQTAKPIVHIRKTGRQLDVIQNI